MKELTKTNYILWRECPKNAWYKVHNPDLYYASPLSEYDQKLLREGVEVDEVARRLYSDGVLVPTRGEEGVAETKRLMEAKTPILFQASFSHDGYYAALDILRYDADTNTYHIYEVKGSGSVDKKAHIPDAAFQKVLLEMQGYHVGTCSIIHLNSDYIRQGELRVSKLFHTEDITEAVKEIEKEVRDSMQEARDYLWQESEPAGNCCCIYKGRSAHCTTFAHANPEVPAYGVHDISRIGTSKTNLRQLVNAKLFQLHEIPEHIELTDGQKAQVEAYLRDEIHTDHYEIEKELDALVFPLYFLDYETFIAPIPRYDGYHPYQQIPFQYSLHILRAPDAELEHREFLHTEDSDPARAIATALTNDIGGTGTVISWKKSFEAGRNAELAERFPEHAKQLHNINDRMYDLMDIFTKRHYVHKDFLGKTSIKNILPVLAPECSYKELSIQNGGSATERWERMVSPETSTEEKEQIALDLREYCTLDTYAMYAIWKHLYHDILGK
jgi:hypothetical protein